jgi:hypothetical protein
LHLPEQNTHARAPTPAEPGGLPGLLEKNRSDGRFGLAPPVKSPHGAVKKLAHCRPRVTVGYHARGEFAQLVSQIDTIVIKFHLLFESTVSTVVTLTLGERELPAAGRR